MTTQYYAYRIFLNQHPNEFLFKSKEEAFINAFEFIKEKNRNEFFDYGNEHILYYIKNLGRDIYIFQLARKHTYEKPIAGETKIEQISDVDYPFIYLIFHLKLQIVLMQKDSSVFQTLDSVKSKIERFFIEKMGNDGVTCSLIEITDQRDFWHKLDELDFIEKVELEYAPPNFFGGKNSVDKITKEVQEETNYDKFKIILQNKYEGLKFGYENFKEHIQRLSSGAGDFLVEGLSDGIKVVIRKFSIPFKKEIADIENETQESLEETFDKINDLNKDANR